MARNGSGDSLNMGTWADEDDPGAGAQTFDGTGEAGTGLNGNFIRAWAWFMAFFSAKGVVANDKIDGNAIKASAVDGSTLEASASTGAKVFRIKDLGVTTAKIANDAITAFKILAGAVGTTHLADGSVTTAKIVDANITAVKIAANVITASKMTHDNNSRRIPFPITILSGNGQAQAFRMKRSGVITAFSVSSDNANSDVGQTYATGAGSSTGKFSAGDKLSISRNTSTGVTQPRVAGTNVTALALSDANWATDVLYCVIEVEFDD